MNLDLDRLESRDVPAAFVASAYDAAFQPIPGWAGPVVTASGDFDGNGSVDTAYAAGPDGAPRVVVYSGGEFGATEPSSIPGTVKPLGADDVIIDQFVFEESFRGGADMDVIRRPGQADLLVFAPGAGGGARLRFMALDGSGYDRSVLAFDDPNYRGGLNTQATTYNPAFPVGEHVFGLHLLVTPKAGGGPRASVYDAGGDQIATLFYGPQDDRREYRVIASDVDVPGVSQRRGLYVEVEGRVSAFDWSGAEYPV